MLVTTTTTLGTSHRLDGPERLSRDGQPRRVGRYLYGRSIPHRKKFVPNMLFSIPEEHVTLGGPNVPTMTANVTTGRLGRARFTPGPAPSPTSQDGRSPARSASTERRRHRQRPYFWSSKKSSTPSLPTGSCREKGILENQPSVGPFNVQDHQGRPRRRPRGLLFHQIFVLPSQVPGDETIQADPLSHPPNLDDYCRALIRIKEKQNRKKIKICAETAECWC